jgi:Predicted nucleotidyltransferases
MEQVEKFLENQDAVVLSYLFGSVAQQRAGKLSDVDLAVYLDDSLNSYERFDLELELLSDLGDIIGTDRVDLVVMNDAPISLNFEIIKANHPLFIRDNDLKVDFEHYIMSRYLDRQFYNLRWADDLLRKTANRIK